MRLGRILVSGRYLLPLTEQNPFHNLRLIFSGLTVLDAFELPGYDGKIFLCWSEQFDEVQDAAMPPFYELDSNGKMMKLPDSDPEKIELKRLCAELTEVRDILRVRLREAQAELEKATTR